MSDYSEKIVFDVVEWIDHNLHERLLIKDVAMISGYSPYHFQRLFRNVTGGSLGKYIRNKKLEAARMDLIFSNMKVIDVAVKYGFETQQMFTRSFKRKYKLPPGSYQRVVCSEISGSAKNINLSFV